MRGCPAGAGLGAAAWAFLRLGRGKRCEEGCFRSAGWWCGIGQLALAAASVACQSLWELEQTNSDPHIRQGSTSTAPAASVTGSRWQISSFASPSSNAGQRPQGSPWLHRRNLRGTQLQRRRACRATEGCKLLRGTPIWLQRKAKALRIQQRASRSRYIWRPHIHLQSPPRSRMMRVCSQYAFQILRYAAIVHTITSPWLYTRHTRSCSGGVTGEVLSRRWISIREAPIWIIDTADPPCS